VGAAVELKKGSYKLGDMAATREAYGKALLEIGDIDKDVVVLDADLSGSTQTKHFAKAFPERFFNMGIAENNMMGVAAGLARAGKKPFASSFAMFAAGRAWEFVRNSIAHNHLVVRVCATHSGLTVGEDGASHQIIEDIALMRAIPEMQVLVPADAQEAYQMIYASLEFTKPTYIRLGRSKVPVIFDENYNFELGKANLITDGNDLTVVACGVMVSRAIEAVKILKDKGINVELINCGSIKPLDVQTLSKSVSKTKKLITIEEHNVMAGMGDAIASALLENNISSFKFKKMGVQDKFGQSGPGDQVLDHYGLGVKDIVSEAEKINN
jgi:transketolase